MRKVTHFTNQRRIETISASGFRYNKLVFTVLGYDFAIKELLVSRSGEKALTLKVTKDGTIVTSDIFPKEVSKDGVLLISSVQEGFKLINNFKSMNINIA